MVEEVYPQNLEQPALFKITDPTTGMVELFPAVWSALEDLISPNVSVRHIALDRLLELGAPRLTPLVVYTLATRLTDPDLFLRCRIVQILGDVLSPDEQGGLPPASVSRCLNAYLIQMRIRSIYSLLEVAVQDAGLERHAGKLLSVCPYAGNHLASILSDRKLPIPIRQKAAQMIGIVGFLDAMSTLEHLEERLEARLSGQQAMPFAPPSIPSELELLPTIRSSLLLLHSL